MVTVPKTQRAAQYNPKTNKVELNTIPVPEIRDDEFLIRTVAASLCHSDAMLIEGLLPTAPKEPVTIGHEATGQVVRVGSRVRGFKEGDMVGFINAYGACFNCEGCRNHYVYCSAGTMVMQGFSRDGYFQEYCVIDPNTAVVLPENMDASLAAPIFCAGITAYNAVHAANLKVGDWLAVIGCGGLGQLAIKYAKANGYKVAAVDIDVTTLALAQESGADAVFNSRADKDFNSKLIQKTGGGANAVAVFVAVKAGYDVAPATLRVGGKLVVVGVASQNIELSSYDIALARYSVVGANNAAQPELLKECAQFTADHGIISPSKFYELDQINEMIDLMQKERMGGTRMAVKFVKTKLNGTS